MLLKLAGQNSNDLSVCPHIGASILDFCFLKEKHQTPPKSHTEEENKYNVKPYKDLSEQKQMGETHWELV